MCTLNMCYNKFTSLIFLFQYKFILYKYKGRDHILTQIIREVRHDLQDKDRERSQDKERERSQDKERERSQDKERERSQDKDRERSHIGWDSDAHGAYVLEYRSEVRNTC